MTGVVFAGEEDVLQGQRAIPGVVEAHHNQVKDNSEGGPAVVH
jgi:hypothetical protein